MLGIKSLYCNLTEMSPADERPKDPATRTLTIARGHFTKYTSNYYITQRGI